MRAKLLTLQEVRPSFGKCPWRIQYQVDELPVNAFFRPPKEVAGKIGCREVGLVAAPILCDLAAEVRPLKVRVERQAGLPEFQRVFDDAVGALIAEQDASWNRSRFTALPKLDGDFVKWKRSDTSLNPRRVILGFSGGKDSIVSLFALLEAGYEVCPVLLNEGDRTWQDLRKWIPKLKKHGLQVMVAYLMAARRKNLRELYGEWYFSSYQLGWLLSILALCAVASGAGVICLGIEASADFSFTDYRGQRINHQHQKTTAHLQMLEKFYRRVLHPELIGSPIAEVTDTEVFKALVEQVPRKFQEFSSCGAANSRSKHCGSCPKCAFGYAILQASARGRELSGRIFRHDLLEDVELYQPWLNKRMLVPPGCVGPKQEVWDAFETLVGENPERAVVRKWKNSHLRNEFYLAKKEPDVREQLMHINSALSLPVADATRLVRKWVGKRR